MSDIFREVSEDIRNEQLKSLWDRYGLLVIGAIVLLVLSVAGWVMWQNYARDQQAEAAIAFLKGEQLLLDGEAQAAAAHFETLASDSGTAGYTAIARMKQAAALIASGNNPQAVAVLDQLASDAGADKLWRNLAALKAAFLLSDSASGDELKLRLSPFTGTEHPLRHSAREALAFLALREGRKLDAAATFRVLADDLTAPQGVRARAAQMLEGLPPPPSTPAAQPDAATPSETGAVE